MSSILRKILDIWKYIRNLYGNDLIALVTAEIEAITNSRMQQLTNAHSSEISKSLKNLCTHGYLFADGRGRGTVYTLNPNFGNNVGTSDQNELIINKKRIPKKEIENMILQICSQYYITLAQIAAEV